MIKFKTASLGFLMLLGYSSHAQSNDTLTAALQNPDTVTVLNLSEKGLFTLPESLAKLKNLRILILNRNKFSTIPPVVFKLKNLEALSISGWSPMDSDTSHEHTIKAIPPEIASLTKLSELNLEMNGIDSLPPEFAKLKALRLLFLYRNALSMQSLSIISKLDSLETLDISANDITKLPDNFGNLKNLKILAIDNEWEEGCPVGETVRFPKVICTLTKLEVLSLSGQDIKVIPDEIGNLTKLQSLNLVGCSFTKIPESIGNLKELTYLNIELTCLGEMLKLCDMDFYFPKSICNLQKLERFYFDTRKVPEAELSRIKKCLPKKLFQVK